MKNNASIQTLMSLIQDSPSCFHVIHNIKTMLLDQGFCPLSEQELWKLELGGSYFVTRNNSSLIAFTIPKSGFDHYHIIASHSDFPCFKLKENPELTTEEYQKLNVEKYGGMLMAPWLDRPLSIAGRVYVDTENGIVEKLVHIDRDLALIPNLAIHMNREANDGYKYNAQKDMLPLFGDISQKTSFLEILAKAADVQPEQILGHDLFLYNRQKPTLWGSEEQYLSAPRLDDLECAYGSLLGFLNGKKADAASVYCVFDNEEVGSGTRQGAASSFLADTLHRICLALGLSQETYLTQLAKSFLISADNAHAVHPNHPDKADPTNRPYLNRGVVLKFNGNQKYCTDGASAAVFRKLCRQIQIPCQTYANRSDMAGGSTLGNLATTLVPIQAADMGLPQLAMHSPYETVGVRDWEDFLRLCEAFYC